MVVTDRILELTRSLSVVVDFPGYSPQAVAKIADNIGEMCYSEWQAEGVIAELTSGRLSKWLGPQMITNVFEDLYPHRDQRAEWLDDRPEPIECQDCLDL